MTKSQDSYRHGNLREAMLKTSLRLIKKDGVEKLSIREAAKAAGVSHQAPYRHFKDRDGLLAALAQDGYEKLYVSIIESIKPGDRAPQKLIHIGEGYLGWAAANPEHFRLLFSRSIPDYESSEGLQSASRQILEFVLKTVQENQDSGDLRAGDIRNIARQFWAAVHGVSRLFIDQQFKPIGEDLGQGRQLVREVVTNLMMGLRK